jgi:hypothetical protein
VPGASHVDRFEFALVTATMGHNLLGLEPTQSYDQTLAQAGNYGQEQNAAISSAACAPSGNEFPRRYAVDAALAALQRWVSTGRPARVASPFTFATTGDLNGPLPLYAPPDALNRDAFGNALGGIRSPVLTVPVASYVGSTCTLLGQTIPLPSARLRSLYPSHASYVDALAAAIRQQVAAGFMVPLDAQDLIARACESEIGGPPSSTCPSVAAPSPYAMPHARRSKRRHACAATNRSRGVKLRRGPGTDHRCRRHPSVGVRRNA